MNSWAWATSAAAATRPMSGSSSRKAMLRAMVSENTKLPVIHCAEQI